MIGRRASLFVISLTIVLLIFCAPLRIARAATYADKVLSYSPEAYWQLNELSGTTANDSSGNGYNELYNGVTLDQIDGAGSTMGRAGLWDGLNDRIAINSAVNTLSSTDFTITVWVKTLDTSATLRYAMDREGRVGILQTSTGAKFAGNYKNIWTENGVTDTDWHCLTVVFHTNVFKFYKDGVYIGEQTSVTGLANVSYASIGSSYSGGGSYWYGYIQHLAIFTYVLSDDQIEILADSDPPATPTPTNTSTATNTYTPRPPQIIMTLSNGNQFELDYTITAGDIAQFIPALLLIAFLIFLIILKLVRR